MGKGKESPLGRPGGATEGKLNERLRERQLRGLNKIAAGRDSALGIPPRNLPDSINFIDSIEMKVYKVLSYRYRALELLPEYFFNDRDVELVFRRSSRV